MICIIFADTLHQLAFVLELFVKLIRIYFLSDSKYDNLRTNIQVDVSNDVSNDEKQDIEKENENENENENETKSSSPLINFDDC